MARFAIRDMGKTFEAVKCLSVNEKGVNPSLFFLITTSSTKQNDLMHDTYN
jgi:hypothetical protein